MKVTVMENVTQKIGLIALALIVLFGGISLAHADKINLPEIGAVAKDPMVDIMLGKAEMVDLGGDVADVLVANPSIVDVMAVKSDRLYLVGAALGDTNIITLDADGNILKKLNIHVQMDTDKLSAMINDLYPNEQVHVQALTDQVVLTGEVSTPATANGIARLVAEYAGEIQGARAGSVDEVVTNMLKVRGEQQVMLRVKIIEVSRDALKDLGLEVDAGDGVTENIGNVAGAVSTAAGLGLTGPVPLAVGVLNYLSGDFGPLQFTARALEQEGILNTLAEPNLTAISGQQAGFLAGGEFPIPTERDDDGNLVYEYHPFGVSLNFRPVVMSESRINLEMTTEISTASFDQGLQLNGINIPTFNVRRAQTTVELPSGGTLMIAGLLKSEAMGTLSQLPGAENIPIVGDLIKSDTFTRNESEVIVMITPYLVQPYAQNQSAAAPMPQPQSGMPALTMDDLENNEAIQRAGKVAAPTPPASANMQPAAASSMAMTPPAKPKDIQENKVQGVFGNYVRRAYGKQAPEGLMNEQGSYGYMMD